MPKKLWLVKCKYRVRRSTGHYTRWYATIMQGETDVRAGESVVTLFWKRNAGKRHEIEDFKILSIEPY